MLDLGLAGKRVVVTGGASNIGRGIVHAFAAQQAHVLIVDRDVDKAAATRAEALALGAAQCTVVPADLGQPADAAAVIDGIVAEPESIDVLVNNFNFGWGDPALLLATDPAHWDRMWRMNLGVTIATSRSALAAMRTRRQGAIVNIASDAAQGVPNQSVYGAMKAGVVAFTKATAKEFGRYGIRINVIAPGIVHPQPGDAGAGSVWNRGAEVLSQKQIDDTVQLTALKRPTRASDIAHTALYLGSEVMARQVSGQTISVSGGWWMP